MISLQMARTGKQAEYRPAAATKAVRSRIHILPIAAMTGVLALALIWSGLAFGRGAPESFADLAEQLLPGWAGRRKGASRAGARALAQGAGRIAL